MGNNINEELSSPNKNVENSALNINNNNKKSENNINDIDSNSSFLSKKHLRSEE